MTKYEALEKAVEAIRKSKESEMACVTCGKKILRYEGTWKVWLDDPTREVKGPFCGKCKGK